MSGKKETSVLERKRLLPKYNSPRARRVRLPCGLTYFCTFCVAFKLEHCVALDCKDFDVNELTELTDYTLTDNAPAEMKREHSFFTIYVNARTRMIDGVVYLGNGKPEVHNYCALVGLPESLINLMFRYNEALEEGKHDTKAVDNNFDESDTVSETEQEQRQQETSRCTNTLTRTSARELSSESSLTGAGLTARTVHGKLDLIEYLRLPHLQTIYYDRFSTFFTHLHGKMQQHVEAMRLREQILTAHQMDTFLSKEDSDKYKSMLTNAQSNFNYQVQLELLKFLHDNKDFLPQNMYLPDVTTHLKASKQKS